jgi:hypothetical protein
LAVAFCLIEQKNNKFDIKPPNIEGNIYLLIHYIDAHDMSNNVNNVLIKYSERTSKSRA